MGIKKRLAGAALAAGIGVAAISGGTFALFTDSATNAGNTIAAGTVSLSDETGSGNVFATLNVSNLAPGDSDTGTITVKNDGTLEEWVKIESVTGSGDLFSGTTPATATGDTDVVKLAPGDSYTFDVSYSFPLAADNSYQGKQGSIEVKVQSVQAKNNTNSTVTDAISWN
jgi:spore coat-associated protein N